MVDTQSRLITRDTTAYHVVLIVSYTQCLRYRASQANYELRIRTRMVNEWCDLRVI